MSKKGSRRNIHQVLSLDAVAAGSLCLFLEGVLCIFVIIIKMYETRPMDVLVLFVHLEEIHIYTYLSAPID